MFFCSPEAAAVLHKSPSAPVTLLSPVLVRASFASPVSWFRLINHREINEGRPTIFTCDSRSSGGGRWSRRRQQQQLHPTHLSLSFRKHKPRFRVFCFFYTVLNRLLAYDLWKSHLNFIKVSKVAGRVAPALRGRFKLNEGYVLLLGYMEQKIERETKLLQMGLEGLRLLSDVKCCQNILRVNSTLAGIEIQHFPTDTNDKLLKLLGKLKVKKRDMLTIIVMGKGRVGKSSTVSSIIGERTVTVIAFQPPQSDDRRRRITTATK
ncbi:unnamed protein product [Lactuca virosa]|uniref:SRP54-type proteins GTP-binding domain-containing protein n=1 Tax=Lactuca virosa TaxID=75947 RepID=A0AAU9LFH0_9ASTR|nr:unnamed protein product [Lactuca virosa]